MLAIETAGLRYGGHLSPSQAKPTQPLSVPWIPVRMIKVYGACGDPEIPLEGCPRRLPFLRTIGVEDHGPGVP